MSLICLTLSERGKMTKKDENRKEAILKKGGTLNPTPEDIEDSLFSEEEFFDKRDLMQVKYEMLRRVNNDNWTVKAAAEKFGFSRPSYYEVHNSFKTEGLIGLLPRKRGPKGAHKLTDAVMAFIESVMKSDPEIKAAELVGRVNLKFSVDVHPTSIERALARRKKK